MAFDPVGEEFDQGRAEIGAGAVGGPAGGGVDGERVVAVDPQAGNAVADGAGGEGGELAAGDPGEGRDRPLVVDDVEDDRRAIDPGEGAGGVEVALGGRAVADIAGGDPAVAADRRGHRPAHRLRELGREVARDGEEAVRVGRVHDRQLAALQRVAAVRIDLAHHLDERIVAGDEQALLAVGREAHVVAVEGVGAGDRDRLLAGRTSCRSWSCPAAGRGTCGRRRPAPSSCRAGSGAGCRDRASGPRGRPPCPRRRAPGPANRRARGCRRRARRRRGGGRCRRPGISIWLKSTSSPGRARRLRDMEGERRPVAGARLALVILAPVRCGSVRP